MSVLKVGILCNGSGKGGIYNMLAGFNIGLKKGFEDRGIQVDYITDIIKHNKKIPPLFIAFNASGHNYFQNILKSGAHLALWSVDSFFYQNYNFFKTFASTPNFSFISITSTDKKLLQLFYPQLNNTYIPLAVDPEVWKYDENAEKEYDVIFTSSIADYEADIEQLRQTLKPGMFKLFQDMYAYLTKHPEKDMWEAFKSILSSYNMKILPEDADFYADFFRKVTYIITYARRVQLVKNLENVGVKVWGSQAWNKYISGKNEYMGPANMDEVISIYQKSKIALHQHPLQVAKGIHDRVLNTSSTGAFVISNDVPQIREEFGDNFIYDNFENAEKICDKVSYYLENDDIRLEKALAAREITLDRHTWKNRVDDILSLTKHNFL